MVMGLVVQVTTNRPLEVAGVVWHEVGQCAELGVAPARLDRVKLRRVSRQPLEVDTFESTCCQLLGGGAMYGPAIPADYQRPTKVSAKLLHESDDFVRANVLVVNLKRRANLASRRRECHSANHTQPVIAVPGTLHRRLAARCPGATIYRLQAKASFIDEDDAGAAPAGLFLMRGQSALRHRLTAAASFSPPSAPSSIFKANRLSGSTRRYSGPSAGSSPR